MKKPSLKTLQKKIEHLNRDAVILRDGEKCQLADDSCGGRLVADHVFSRGVKELFCDPDNLISVCMSHNGKKNWDRNATRWKIYDLVKKRIGSRRFSRLLSIADRHKPFPDWSKRWYLEEQLELAQERLEYYKLRCE